MTDLDLTGYEHTAAAILVRHIDDCLVGDIWDRHDHGPGLWSWRSSWAGREQVVAVNALTDRVLVPVHGWPAQVGPTVLGGDVGGLFASATLPQVSDQGERQIAVAAIAQVVPDLDPATWQTP